MSAEKNKIKMLYNFDERLQTHFFCGVSCNNDLQTYIIRVNKVYFKFMLTINDLSQKKQGCECRTKYFFGVF